LGRTVRRARHTRRRPAAEMPHSVSWKAAHLPRLRPPIEGERSGCGGGAGLTGSGSGSGCVAPRRRYLSLTSRICSSRAFTAASLARSVSTTRLTVQAANSLAQFGICIRSEFERRQAILSIAPKWPATSYPCRPQKLAARAFAGLSPTCGSPFLVWHKASAIRKYRLLQPGIKPFGSTRRDDR
jgi:hypothetical protein